MSLHKISICTLEELLTWSMLDVQDCYSLHHLCAWRVQWQDHLSVGRGRRKGRASSV